MAKRHINDIILLIIPKFENKQIINIELNKIQFIKKIKLPIFIIALLFIFKSLMISSTINNPDDMSGAVQNIFSYIFIPISFKNIVIRSIINIIKANKRKK